MGQTRPFYQLAQAALVSAVVEHLNHAMEHMVPTETEIEIEIGTEAGPGFEAVVEVAAWKLKKRCPLNFGSNDLK